MLDGYTFELGFNQDDIGGETTRGRALKLVQRARAAGKGEALKALLDRDGIV